MALPTILAGHRLGSAAAPHVIEAFLDYTCPFSGKFFNKFTEEVFPHLEQKYPGQFQFIFRNQIQPWHPHSTVVHEAALAVEYLDSAQFYPYSKLLFERTLSAFSDKHVYYKSWHQLNEDLAELAATLGAPKVTKENVLKLLLVEQQPDDYIYGNIVNNRLKYCIKLGRQQAIHVSPTVLLDGLINRSIESSWTLEQWKELIAKEWGLK